MKKIFLIIALGIAALSASAQKPALNNLADSLSYYIGNTEGAYTGTSIRNNTSADPKFYNDCVAAMEYVFTLPDSADNYLAALKRAVELRTMVRQMQEQQGLDMDPAMFLAAFKEGLNNTNMSMDQIRAQVDMTQGLMKQAQEQAKARREAEIKAKSAENEAAGKAYVDALKKKDKKIATTTSGLSYKAVKKGKGATAKSTDKVKVHYTGKLIDGTVFDSSVERGEPATFSVAQLIPGFTEGLQLMNPVSKYTFYIPASIGYGDQGAGGKIEPGATLVFDVELLEILPEEQSKQ